MPRLTLAGLSGGAGKTIVSLGLCRAWKNTGRRVRPFKKGPDYIDAAWLGLAAGADASNLDPFLLEPDVVTGLFCDKMAGFDLAVIEGNRGLFDGKDVSGTCSTAELARRLSSPVILVLDATKMTRTAAALVKGCATFEPGLNLAGVILNRTAGDRHRRILRESIKHYTGIPVLGELPKMPKNPIPERHMGLISNREYAGQDIILNQLASFVADWTDLDRLLAISACAPQVASAGVAIWPQSAALARTPRIGYIRDAALWFYYPENLEALERAGAELVELSLLTSAGWPEIHGLYLGGGFPETQAQALADNAAVRTRVLALSRAGMPIYAECGGFMYLCRELRIGAKSYPMAGIFPLATTLCERPQGLGYSQALVVAENPFHEIGETIKGHEFHYSMCLAEPRNESASGEGAKPLRFTLDMTRGSGMMGGKDGIIENNTFAAYTHIHALSAPKWAGRFVAAAAGFAQTLEATAAWRNPD
ncbi:MAG: cobyrinate a,c-diamide synthase [Desulfovibrionaceae bacterium]|nr:cobyrinate a,c-diamide synthase [Desulfovibrionaceae bacterium]MBF0512506.1 cobyrinate a,c-diamide synthase [Desulfovibrionaceae bacterium]